MGPFLRQSTACTSEKSGTDARFPSEVRQNVVKGECRLLTTDQKVRGSSPFGRVVVPGTLSLNMKMAQQKKLSHFFRSLCFCGYLFVDVHDDDAVGAAAAILIGYDAQHDATRASCTVGRTARTLDR